MACFQPAAASPLTQQEQAADTVKVKSCPSDTVRKSWPPCPSDTVRKPWPPCPFAREILAKSLVSHSVLTDTAYTVHMYCTVYSSVYNTLGCNDFLN